MGNGNWNHAVCDACWEKKVPGRDPVRIVEATKEVCCLCGADTQSGIWVRANPANMSCRHSPFANLVAQA